MSSGNVEGHVVSADWSRVEMDATVSDYLAMLASELAGVSYNDAAHRRRLLLLRSAATAIYLRYAMTNHPLETWHRLVRSGDASGLNDLLADDVVFYSPVVHTPQHGRKLAAWYLGAAFHVFFNPTFRYVREIVGASDAMLEFETDIDGVLVNGVDIIKWNDSGRIVEFKVMLRPLKAINLVHQRMAAMLQRSSI